MASRVAAAGPRPAATWSVQAVVLVWLSPQPPVNGCGLGTVGHSLP